jgi:hypothetical protein
MNEQDRKAKQARLPDALTGPVIASMEFDSTCYAVPWAMWADEDGLLWLHPDYAVTPCIAGTSRMRIELRTDGYHVWPPRDHVWQKGAKLHGVPSQPWIPVAVLEGDG